MWNVCVYSIENRNYIFHWLLSVQSTVIFSNFSHIHIQLVLMVIMRFPSLNPILSQWSVNKCCWKFSDFMWFQFDYGCAVCGFVSRLIQMLHWDYIRVRCLFDSNRWCVFDFQNHCNPQELTHVLCIRKSHACA